LGKETISRRNETNKLLRIRPKQRNTQRIANNRRTNFKPSGRRRGENYKTLQRKCGGGGGGWGWGVGGGGGGGGGVRVGGGGGGGGGGEESSRILKNTAELTNAAGKRRGQRGQRRRSLSSVRRAPKVRLGKAARGMVNPGQTYKERGTINWGLKCAMLGLLGTSKVKLGAL